VRSGVFNFAAPVRNPLS